MLYDVFIIAVLLFAMYRGAQRGAIFQVAAVASVVLCFVFAEAISAAVGPLVPLKAPLNNWVVMLAAFLVFSFASFGFGRVLERWVEKAGMKEFNKHVGGAFGLLKGVALALVITFFVVTLSPRAREMLQSSRSGHLAADIMHAIHPVMPENLQRALVSYINKIEAPAAAPVAPATDPFGTPQVAGPQGSGRPTDGFGGLLDDLLPASQPTTPGVPPLGQSDPQSGGWNVGGWDPFGREGTTSSGANQSPQQQPSGWGNWGPAQQPQQQTFPNQQPPQVPQQANSSVDAIMNRLPYVLSGVLDRKAREAFSQHTPQEQAAMEQQLSSARMDQVRGMLDGWLRGEPVRGVAPASQYPSGGGFPAYNQAQNAPGGYGGTNANPTGYGRPVPEPVQPWTPQPTSQPTPQPAAQPSRQSLPQGWPQSQRLPTQPFGQQPAGQQQPVQQPSMRQLGGQLLGNAINQWSQGQQPSMPSLESVRAQLRNMPADLSAAVMADYQADLTGGVDPDRSTNAATPLQQRVNAAAARLAGRSGTGGAYRGGY